MHLLYFITRRSTLPALTFPALVLFLQHAKPALCTMQNLFSSIYYSPDQYVTGTTACVEELARFAFLSRNQIIAEKDAEQLIANLSTFTCQLLFKYASLNEDNCNELQYIVCDFNLLNRKKKPSHRKLERLWKTIVALALDISFPPAKLNYVPVNELAFFPKAIRINFSKMGLSQIHIESLESLSFLEELEELVLSGNNFTEMPCFRDFKKLKRVEMNSCPLRELTAKRYLDFENKIVPSKSICGIYCANSTVSFISKDFFDAFVSMKELCLFNTRITDISMLDEHFWKEHENLKTVDFQNCRIEKFPENIGEKSKKRLRGVKWNLENEAPQRNFLRRFLNKF